MRCQMKFLQSWRKNWKGKYVVQQSSFSNIDVISRKVDEEDVDEDGMGDEKNINTMDDDNVDAFMESLRLEDYDKEEEGFHE